MTIAVGCAIRDWFCLTGTWEFSLDPVGSWQDPSDVVWRGRIEMPFAPEIKKSGVAEMGFPAPVDTGEQFRLQAPCGRTVFFHFGAFHYLATVWVNGRYVAHQEDSCPFFG